MEIKKYSAAIMSSADKRTKYVKVNNAMMMINYVEIFHFATVPSSWIVSESAQILRKKGKLQRKAENILRPNGYLHLGSIMSLQR